MLPFESTYRLRHPENYLFSLSIFPLWIKVSGKCFIYSEDRGIDNHCLQADGVRVVNNLNKDQHLELHSHLAPSGVNFADAFYSAAGERTAFVILTGVMDGFKNVAMMGRLEMNDNKQVTKFWGRRRAASEPFSQCHIEFLFWILCSYNLFFS